MVCVCVFVCVCMCITVLLIHFTSKQIILKKYICLLIIPSDFVIIYCIHITHLSNTLFLTYVFIPFSYCLFLLF